MANWRSRTDILKFGLPALESSATKTDEALNLMRGKAHADRSVVLYRLPVRRSEAERSRQLATELARNQPASSESAGCQLLEKREILGRTGSLQTAHDANLLEQHPIGDYSRAPLAAYYYSQGTYDIAADKGDAGNRLDRKAIRPTPGRSSYCSPSIFTRTPLSMP